jgi:FkbM family methyltransferase
LDIGANQGHWSLLFRSVFPDAAILMVEAQPQHAATLARVCQRLGNSRYVITLLGPTEAAAVPFVVMDDGAGGTGSSVLAENSDVPRSVVELPMTTVDRTLAANAFPAPDFLKLDVQGYELEVLKGARAALGQADLVLLEVSVWQYNAGSPLLREVIDWMATAGFVVYELFDIHRRPDGVLLQIDVLFVRRDSRLLADPTTRFGA